MKMDCRSHSQPLNKTEASMLFMGFDEKFVDNIKDAFQDNADFTPRKLRYSIVALGEKDFEPSFPQIDCNVLFIPYERPLPQNFRSESAIDCGMNEKCSLTLSSVGIETAMLCIKRDIFYNGAKIEQSEKKISLIPKLSLYDNMVLGGIASMTKKYL